MKLKFPNIDYYKIILHFTIGIDFLFAMFLLMSYFRGISLGWDGYISYLFYFVVFVNTVFFTFKIKKIPEAVRDRSSMIYYFSHFFLLTLVIIAINQFVKNPWVIGHLNYISALSIAFGFLTFYAHRDRVEREIEEEKISEDRAEKKRYLEFDEKFRWLARFNFSYGIMRAFRFAWSIRRVNFFGMILFWFIGCFRIFISPFVFLARLPYSLVRWMYGEGWAFSVPFVAIAILFIGIKIGMPLIFSVSYIDEYFHIFSGIEFFKTGHFAVFYNDRLNYTRGAYVSFLVGLFFKLFGQTMFVAKMVPAMIGAIDFFLLYGVAKRFIKRKPYILFLMLIYTISPWVIFNHFYIRFYVFYEFFLLSLTYCFLKFMDGLKNQDKRKMVIYSGVFIFINLINYFFSNDNGKYMIVILSGLLLLYLYLFEIKFNKFLKWGLLIITGIIIWFLMNVPNKLNLLLNAKLTFTSPKNLKYNYYFFNLNIIFSIFFFLSLVTIRKLKSKEFAIIISFFVIFLIHLVSSQDLQMLRGILYFFPAYYLVSIIGFSKLNTSKKLKFLIIIFIFFSIIFNFPQGFSRNGPHIDGEVRNIDYSSAYSFVKSHCNGKIYSLHHHPYISLFYINKTPMINYLDMKIINKNMPIYHQSNNGAWKTVYGGIHVISDKKITQGIFRGINKTCIVIRSKRKHNTRYITKKDEQFLNDHFNVKKFEEINVYYN